MGVASRFWFVLGLMTLGPLAHGASEPPTTPILRVETRTHTATIDRIAVDAGCRLMVTGSQDKTARLWNVPTESGTQPQLLRVLRVPIGSHDGGEVYAVAITSNGRLVAAAGLDVYGKKDSENAIYLFDSGNGSLVHRLDQIPNTVRHLSFSLDNRYLAAALGQGGGLRVWKTDDWTLVAKDTDYGGREAYAVEFDSTGRLYTVAHDGFLRRYGSDFRLESKTKTIGGMKPYGLAVHPTRPEVAVAFSDSMSVEVYETSTLKRLFSAGAVGLAKRAGNLHSVAWSKDGTRLYAGGQYKGVNGDSKLVAVRKWDKDGHGEGTDIFAARDTIMHLAPCGDGVVVSAADTSFGLISSSGAKSFWLEGVSPDMRNKIRGALSVSNDGSKVRFGLGSGGERPVSFDLKSGTLKEEALPPAGLMAAETKILKVTNWEDESEPKLNGRVLHLDEYELARSLAIGPDGSRFVIGADASIRAFDKSGTQLWAKAGPGSAWGVDVTHDGKFAIVAYGDGTIRWLRLSDGEEVLSLFVNTTNLQWVLWTPQGYYSSSPSGDQSIGWQINKGWTLVPEFVTADRLRKHLYRPDVVKRAFELADAEAAVEEAGLHEFKLTDLSNHAPPKFHILSPDDKTRAAASPMVMQIQLDPAVDPVTGVDVKVNGRQVTPRAVRALQPTSAPTTRELKIPLEKGDNDVQITAHNAVGESVQHLVVYLDRQGALDKKGKLLVIAIGVDVYPKLGAENSLHYASADARLMLETLVKRAGPLHTQVKSQLLVTGGSVPPTKANIEDALLLFQEAKPEDTVILYLAGHGINEGADYEFMPENAEDTANGRNFRPSTVIKWHVLEDALQNAQGSRIMFVDTCHSRGAFNDRLIKDAADANIFVLSATDSESEAQERSELSHGVFTYAVAEGLSGKADPWSTGSVSFYDLSSFVDKEVRQLTNGEQKPTVNIAGGKNFVLAKP